MNTSQQVLINLLSRSIGGNNSAYTSSEKTKWDKVYTEALAQDVQTLIYDYIINLPQGNVPKKILEKWQESIEQWEYVHKMQIQDLKELFITLMENKLPVITLTNIVHGYVYPNPGNRLINHVDLLIHCSDIEKSEELLTPLGYTKMKYRLRNSNVFIRPNHTTFELHWSLFQSSRIRKAEDFQNSLWQNTTPINLSSIPIPCLSPEYGLLYLFFHLKNLGWISLTNLCDLVIYLKCNNESIDWKLFFTKVDTYELRQFVRDIFTLCKNIFDVYVPEFYESFSIFSLLHRKLLFDRLFSYNSEYASMRQDSTSGLQKIELLLGLNYRVSIR